MIEDVEIVQEYLKAITALTMESGKRLSARRALCAARLRFRRNCSEKAHQSESAEATGRAALQQQRRRDRPTNFQHSIQSFAQRQATRTRTRAHSHTRTQR
jgi:hypothetical protein